MRGPSTTWPGAPIPRRRPAGSRGFAWPRSTSTCGSSRRRRATSPGSSRRRPRPTPARRRSCSRPRPPTTRAPTPPRAQRSDARSSSSRAIRSLARAPFGPLLGRAYAALGAALLAAGVPADAAKAFAQAQREGLGALATLGLAASELARGKPDVAKGLFEDARDKGTAAIAHAAEYGLAATAFLGGAHKEFRQPALAELDAAPKGRGAPRLLYVLTGLAVEEKDWAGALGFAKRLAS